MSLGVALSARSPRRDSAFDVRGSERRLPVSAAPRRARLASIFFLEGGVAAAMLRVCISALRFDLRWTETDANGHRSQPDAGGMSRELGERPVSYAVPKDKSNVSRKRNSLPT